MDGDEQIRLCLVSYFGPLVQLDKHICLAGVHHFYIRKILLDVLAQLERYCERYIFLIVFSGTDCTGILASMACINHNCFQAEIVIGSCGSECAQSDDEQYVEESHVWDFLILTRFEQISINLHRVISSFNSYRLTSPVQIYSSATLCHRTTRLYLATAVLFLSIFINVNLRAAVPVNKPITFFVTDSLGKRKINLNSDSVSVVPADSSLLNDTTISLIADTINRNDTVEFAQQQDIKDVINYKAEDSIVYDISTKQMYLYNAADVHYQKIQLNSNHVDFDWNTFTLSARGTVDSAGLAAGRPVFTDDGKDYTADSMKYNFKTKKGIVYHVVTKEGDAYIHSEKVKKNEYDEWYGEKSKYTTCDLDHPHFYFKSKKVKVVPNKVMVTGPANLWIADVPTPLYLPFGIFPVKQGKRSGLIIPEYGQIGTQAFFLRNGGYYWAVNDYLGLKFTETAATNGLVGGAINAQYALRYKFSGTMAFSYIRTPPDDPDLPHAKASNSFSVQWSHTQDPRSIPNASFGANVQMQSRDFYQASLIADTRLLSTTFNSAVNFGYTFVGTPFRLDVSLRHSQNLLNKTIEFTLPNIHLGMSRVTPFKSKVQSATPKWYESIGFTYSLDFTNRVSTYDSLLFNASTADKFRFGFNQDFSVDAPLRVLKYLNVTPSFNYQERTYFKGIEKRWDPDTVYVAGSDGRVDTIRGQIKSDTIWRFNSARNFSAQIGINTKVVGIYKFKSMKVLAMRHIFTPSVSFSYSPDFSKDRFKYNKYVQGNANGEMVKYSVFEPDAVYGVPGAGQVAQVGWSLNNSFELKTYSKKDTVTHEQKVGLLDQVNLSGGYNFVADSLRLQPFSLTAVSSRIFNLISLNFNAVFDPYAVDTNNRKYNTFEWTKNKKLLRFASANVSASMSLHSKQKALAPDNQPPPKFMADYVSYNPDQIYNFDIPWNLSLSYNFNISKGTFQNPDTLITVQTVRASGDFNLTPHWKVSLSTGFDISRKQITLTTVSVVRDLHCWELSFNWTPALPTFDRQQFSILLHPKSPTLKDLKLEKKNSLRPL
jgi:hypothetical protein